MIQMVAAGLGWTILPPLGLFRSMGRGARIRVFPFPGKSVHRTIMVAARTDEGAHVAEKSRDAAADALQNVFIPAVKRRMATIAHDITLNKAGAVHVVTTERGTGP